jgi:hypothetical protein
VSPVIHAVASEHIDAPAERVLELYCDPDNWAALFPATIRGARVVLREEKAKIVEVDHVEGKVVNVLRSVSPSCIELTEFKHRYDATFMNEFSPEPGGMRYTLTAWVRLKWPYRLLAPFVKPIVLARMRRYVLAPMKAAAESGGSRSSS